MESFRFPQTWSTRFSLQSRFQGVFEWKSDRPLRVETFAGLLVLFVTASIFGSGIGTWLHLQTFGPAILRFLPIRTPMCVGRVVPCDKGVPPHERRCRCEKQMTGAGGQT